MKITKNQFTFLWIITVIILALSFYFIRATKFPGDVSKSSDDFDWGYLHSITAILYWIGVITILIYGLVNSFDVTIKKLPKFIKSKDEIDETDNKKFMRKVKRVIKWGIFIIILIILYNIFGSFIKESIKMYNTSKLYHNTYTQKVQEKEGFYDKLWKTYLQKEKITNINKETFITVSKLIMENRKDGQNVTWKWLKENQQIPYDEFTKFYADLSSFIEVQREGYFLIEKNCQEIANKNNTLLDTFPNNIYNKVLKCERIDFKYGMLSDSTVNVFKTKKENVK